MTKSENERATVELTADDMESLPRTGNADLMLAIHASLQQLTKSVVEGFRSGRDETGSLRMTLTAKLDDTNDKIGAIKKDIDKLNYRVDVIESGERETLQGYAIEIALLKGQNESLQSQIRVLQAECARLKGC